MSAQKLDFLAVGPQRTASTWLDACLRAHPDLCLPHGIKETFYWDQRRDLPESWYWSHFSEAQAGQKIGEVGATYFNAPDLPETLRAMNPDCRVIVTLRNPVERVISLKRHLKRVGKLTTDGWDEARSRYPEEFGPEFYRENLQRWSAAFPSEKLLVLLTDDIRDDPQGTIERLTKALDVPMHTFRDASEQINVGAEAKNQMLNRVVYGMSRIMRRYRLHGVIEAAKRMGGRKLLAAEAPKDAAPTINPEVADLAALYEGDIAFVESMLGRDLSAWRGLSV